MYTLQLCGTNTPEAALTETVAVSVLTGEVHNHSAGNKYDFFGNFFVAQGLSRVGGIYAREARQFHANYFPNLQGRDGSWTGAGTEQGPGRGYCTAMAILSMTARDHRLPMSRP